MFLAAFMWVGLMAAFEKHGYRPNRIFYFLFLKDVLLPRFENAAIGTPKAAFPRNAAIVLFVAACVNCGYSLNNYYY